MIKRYFFFFFVFVLYIFNKINFFKKLKDYPYVVIGVFIHHSTPFLEEFFEDLSNLKYPKDKISILIHNLIEKHDKEVQRFVDNNQLHYHMTTILPKQAEEWRIRTYLM